MCKYIIINSAQNAFLERTDQKILHNTIKRQVDYLLLQQQFSLDERRDRYECVQLHPLTIYRTKST